MAAVLAGEALTAVVLDDSEAAGLVAGASATEALTRVDSEDPVIGALTISELATRADTVAKRIAPREREAFPETHGVVAVASTTIELATLPGHLAVN